MKVGKVGELPTYGSIRKDNPFGAQSSDLHKQSKQFIRVCERPGRR